MFAYLWFGIHWIGWLVGNLFRRLRRLPDYVVLTLEGDYPELPPKGGNFILRKIRPPKISLFEMREDFQRLQRDPRVRGVVIHLHSLDMPLARVSVLRRMLLDLRAHGKRVVVWSHGYNTSMYYLASAADQVLLLPGGYFMPMGLTQNYVFLADALEAMGMKADFVQISPYKTAADSLMRREMSDEAREMANWLADSSFHEVVTAIAEGRGMTEEQARRLIDQTPCTDLQALEMGLVDALVEEEKLPEFLGEEGKPARLVTWEMVRSRVFRLPPRRPGKYLALMSIEGSIVDGHNQEPPVKPPFPLPFLERRAGDLSVVQTVRQILADKRAVGVVVYVDSPGGSATAAEKMRTALAQLAAAKPLYIVMGPLAASGGYWVSTPAHKIFAQPTTLTGSIGVLSGKVVTGGLFEKLRIHRQSVNRGEHVRMYSGDDLFTEEERRKVWETIRHIYDLFLERVSHSRKMTPEDVDAIGGGRVWTGWQALENGLVDELGGLEEALRQLREETGLPSTAPVRLFTPGKRPLAPTAAPASALSYAWGGVRHLNGRVLCLCPWLELPAF